MVAISSPVVFTQLLHIEPLAPEIPLSPAQQAFNRLLAQLEQARAQWQNWQDATQDVQTRYAKQVRPQLSALWLAQAQLAEQLDALSGQPMNGLDRHTLVQLIVSLSEASVDASIDATVRARLAELHARYADLPQEAAVEQATPQAAVSATAPEADIDWDDPEAVTAYVEAQTQAAQEQAERARAAHQNQRQKIHAQRKAQVAQQANQPSVRAVFRKLASRLHPDREQDPQARVRKTEWMQRANVAYAADDLFALLALQWEVEQLDAQRLATMGDDHLQRYNMVLQEQLQELLQATRDSEAALVDMLGLDARKRYAPHKMAHLLKQYAQSLQQQVTQLEQAALHLRHEPEILTDWLRAQR